jgi:hypothetical protein
VILILAFAVFFLAGVLTVTTEMFTHLLVESSWRRVLKGVFIQAAWFAGTALFWGTSVWILFRLQQDPLAILTLIELLGFAHLPLLAYPLTIAPTIGYRLEQALRLAVYVLFVGSLTVMTSCPALQVAITALPGWLLHFLAVEWRLLKRAGERA